LAAQGRSPQDAIVPKAPSIPRSLTKRPFSLEEARAAGLTHSALKGKAWKRIGAELYRWAGQREDHSLTLSAWRRVLPDEAVFAGATAAWLFGLDLKPADPVEVVVPPSSSLRSRAGLRVRRCEVPPEEVVLRREFCATALLRTLVDLCVGRTPVEALVAIDMALHAGLTDSSALCRYAEQANSRAGAGRLRSLALLAAPAESPMETRLRWLLIQGGLPRPEVQTDLRNDRARFVGRADLYYPSARLVLEYDGGYHRDRMAEDNRRQNLLNNAGYQILRFTAADIYQHADVVVAQVRAALEGRQKVPGTNAREGA
jgi:very-short-patch-repair endonuclease